MSKSVQLPAMAMKQGPHRVFTMVANGPSVLEWAGVSHARRDGTGIAGYQRPEVQGHIKGIVRYLNGAAPMLPNAVVIALDSTCTFTPATEIEGVQSGVMNIPVNDDTPTGWIVDGQQRLTALSRSSLSEFPVTVVAFIAETEAQAREQFVLVNSARSLPKSLIYELLPGTEGLLSLPDKVRDQKAPAEIVAMLNANESGPLFNVIKTHTVPYGRIKDTAMMRAIRSSMSDGALYRVRMGMPDQSWEDQVVAMSGVLDAYWAAVRLVWDDIWDLKPRQSRLLHGGGVYALGLLMDTIAGDVPVGELTTELFVDNLNLIVDQCHWTSGAWRFQGGEVVPWNKLQNTGTHLHALSAFLSMEWMKASRRKRG